MIVKNSPYTIKSTAAPMPVALPIFTPTDKERGIRKSGREYTPTATKIIRNIINPMRFLFSFIYYTLKQLPPTNSLQIELLGKLSLLTPKKYSKNLSKRFAS